MLTKHFGAQMYQLESKMNRLLSALDLLEQRCGGIADAVDKWEFAGEPWVALPKDKADQEILTAFRLVEQFNNQFDNLKVTYSALADRKDHQPQKLKTTSSKPVTCLSWATTQIGLRLARRSWHWG